MSKYIDAEKLIAEIEGYENTAIDAYNLLGEDADFWHGKVVACEDLKTLITSLQQEQPEVDLAEEIKNYFKGFYMDLTDQGYILKNSDGPVGLMSVKDIALHFYELGKNSK